MMTLAALKVVIKKTWNATRDDKVVIVTTLSFQLNCWSIVQYQQLLNNKILNPT